MSRFDPSSPDSPIGKVINSGSSSGIKICAPGNVRGWRNSSTTALLTWDEPYSTCHLCPDATGYEVFGEGIATQSVDRPPFELTGLKADVEYLFYVTAKAAVNNVSTPSPFRLFKLHSPGKPGIPELSELGHAAVTLFWEPSSQGAGPTRYRVYLNGFLVKLVTEPQVSLTHLQSHTEYRVEVRAFNEVGVSEPSFITFQTRLRPPTNLKFSHRNGICRLAWDPVFRKKPAHELSINGQVFTVAPGRWGYNFKLADVSPGPVPHHLKFAVHAQLDGAHSDVALLEHSVDDAPPSQPGAPVVSDVTDTSATLSWEPSSDNVGVNEYRVLLNGMIPYSSSDTLCTFTNLISGTYHWAFVRARDKDGNLSAPSRTAVFKTTGQAPKPQPAPPPVEITALTSTSANLSWKLESGDSGVRISINDEHLRDVLFLERLPLQYLTPDVEYSISVSAFDIFGQLSEPTVLAYVPKDVTPPSTPENLHKGDVTADSVMLIWEESTDDVGLHEYVIYNNCEYFDRTPLTHYTAVDLLPGTYSFEVSAMDISGNASEPAVLTVSIEGEL